MECDGALICWYFGGVPAGPRQRRHAPPSFALLSVWEATCTPIRALTAATEAAPPTAHVRKSQSHLIRVFFIPEFRPEMWQMQNPKITEEAFTRGLASLREAEGLGTAGARRGPETLGDGCGELHTVQGQFIILVLCGAKSLRE